MTDSIIKIDNIPNFDYTKNEVGEASAGTGKTYTIIRIIPYPLHETNINTATIKIKKSRILCFTILSPLKKEYAIFFLS